MKRFIVALCINLFMLSCSRASYWTREQLEDFKDRLEDIDSLDYLDDMEDRDFETLAGKVARAIETNNPHYPSFIRLPSSKDTIRTYVISFLSFHLDADARNLKSLYPYRELVDEKILPRGMSEREKDLFYICLEGKLRARYKSMEFFLGALSYGKAAQKQAEIYMLECAREIRSLDYR